jgi:activating signal cointegrator 1
MKGLQLWQPWASLVAIGAKRIETRHWPAPPELIGQRITIHATKRTSELWLCAEHPFREYHLAADRLPLGAIVATAVLARCAPMTVDGIARLNEVSPHEFAFGSYAVGRFAWVLRDVEPVVPAIPFKGAQVKFLDVPDELLGREPAAPAFERGALL